MIVKNISKLNPKHIGNVYLKNNGLKVLVTSSDANLDNDVINENLSLFTNTMNKDEWTPFTTFFINQDSSKKNNIIQNNNIQEEIEVKKNAEQRRINKASKGLSEGSIGKE